MPRGDGTGPMGMGSMTGRAAGYCAGNAMPGYANPMSGCGWGMGRGGGRGRGMGMGMGWRRGQAAVTYPARAFPFGAGQAIGPRDEVETLKNQAKYFGEALDGINKRLAEIETGSK